MVLISFLMSYLSYLAFQPIYQKKVWGGFNIESFLGRRVPHDQPIGESWDVVDRKDAQSIIKNGPCKGMSLRKALEFYTEDIMGPQWPINKPFPILVKWLDCQDKLSLQVHPPKHLAQELEGESKCENWYFAMTRPQARVMAGLREEISLSEFKKAIDENRLEDCVNTLSVQKGDSLFVPSGRIHAIDAGSLILEIQENSDTTYRVWDWNRLGLDGKPRDLHIAKSLKSINFKDKSPQLIKPGPTVQLLVDCPSFRIRKYTLLPGEKTLNIGVGQGASLLSVVEGRLNLIGASVQNLDDLSMGNTVLLPYAQHFSFEALEPSVVLLTDKFTN